MKLWNNIDEHNAFLRMAAEMNGKPLPVVTINDLPESTQKIAQNIYQVFGVRVIPAAHTFGKGNRGSHRPTDNAITLYYHPDYPSSEIELNRVLFHEAGHAEQTFKEMTYDRESVEGYVMCEQEADNLGWKLSEAWGFVDLFPEDVRTTQSKFLDQYFDCLDTLSYVTGINNALLLAALCDDLRFLRDEKVKAGLKIIAGKKGYLSLDQLIDVLQNRPELVVEFERLMYVQDGFSVTHYGNVDPIKYMPKFGRIEAQKNLSSILTNMKRQTFKGDSNKDDTGKNVIIYDSFEDVTNFIRKVQEVIFGATHGIVKLVWFYADAPDLSIYSAEIKWDEKESAEYRIFLVAGGSEKRHYERYMRYESAMRCFINSFSANCGIIRLESHEMVHKLVYELSTRTLIP